jgi:type I restriction enzyme R subunit
LHDVLGRESLYAHNDETCGPAGRLDLIAALRVHLQPMPNRIGNTQTQADVEMFILDNLYTSLPRPPFSVEETESLAGRIYDFVWQRSAAGVPFAAAA